MEEKREEGFLCPVCGSYEFARSGDFDICPKCGWENDRLQFDNPDFAGGANEMSLNEYKENYRRMTDNEKQ